MNSDLVGLLARPSVNYLFEVIGEHVVNPYGDDLDNTLNEQSASFDKRILPLSLNEMEQSMSVNEFVTLHCNDFIGISQIKQKISQYATTAQLYKKWRDTNKPMKALEFHSIFIGNSGLSDLF